MHHCQKLDQMDRTVHACLNLLLAETARILEEHGKGPRTSD